VNREAELARLHGCYETDDAEMVVVFRWQRLGKTQLVQHSLSDRDDVVVLRPRRPPPRYTLTSSSMLPPRTSPASRGSNRTGKRCSDIWVSRTAS